ncbi:hypothetical protein HY468_05735 [Candidatus Roizmanbacteria bacterium]|nr:hypothetical protein [Candidatus Roizmanbacteria bacterium]
MKNLSFLSNLPGWLKTVLGLVSVVVLGVVLSLFVNLQTAQTQTSPDNPTPSVFLPLVSQFRSADSQNPDYRPDDIIQQSSSVIRAEKEWEIYVDPFYGYSIQYPKGWYLRPTPSGAAWQGGVAQIATFDPTIEGSKGESARLAEEGYVKIDIGVSTTPRLSNESLASWLSRRGEDTPVQYQDSKSVKVGEESSIELIIPSRTTNLPSGKMIWIPKGNEVLYISINEFPEHSQYHEIIDKILSTFSLLPNSKPQN